MKKLSLTLLLGLVALTVNGQIQETEGVKSVISASASRAENLNHTVTDQSSPTQTVTINSVSMVVGSPYLGIIQSPFQPSNPSNYTVDNQKDLGKIEAFRQWLLDMVANEQEQITDGQIN